MNLARFTSSSKIRATRLISELMHSILGKEISSVWPSLSLFSTVKSGDYDLQLVLETENGRVESPKVNVSIDASKSAKP